jgi:hypothetical protein
MGTIASWINKCIKVMGDKPLSEVKKDVEKIINKYETGIYTTDVLVRSSIMAWLKTKNLTPKTKPPVIKVPKTKKSKKTKEIEEEVPEETDDEMLPYIEPWIQTYWSIAVKIGIFGYKGNTPTVYVVRNSTNNSLGFYRRSDKSITIITDTWNEEDRKTFVRIMNKKDPVSVLPDLSTNESCDRFFGFRFPSATIPHELEHARQNNPHEEGVHHNVIGKLIKGDTKTYRSFDEASNFVYEQILANGFYEEYFKKLKVTSG